MGQARVVRLRSTSALAVVRQGVRLAAWGWKTSTLLACVCGQTRVCLRIDSRVSAGRLTCVCGQTLLLRGELATGSLLDLNKVVALHQLK